MFRGPGGRGCSLLGNKALGVQVSNSPAENRTCFLLSLTVMSTISLLFCFVLQCVGVVATFVAEYEDY